MYNWKIEHDGVVMGHYTFKTKYLGLNC